MALRKVADRVEYLGLVFLFFLFLCMDWIGLLGLVSSLLCHGFGIGGLAIMVCISRMRGHFI